MLYEKIMKFISEFLLISDIDMDEEFPDDEYVQDLLKRRKNK